MANNKWKKRNSANLGGKTQGARRRKRGRGKISTQMGRRRKTNKLQGQGPAVTIRGRVRSPDTRILKKGGKHVDQKMLGKSRDPRTALRELPARELSREAPLAKKKSASISLGDYEGRVSVPHCKVGIPLSWGKTSYVQKKQHRLP